MSDDELDILVGADVGASTTVQEGAAATVDHDADESKRRSKREKKSKKEKKHDKSRKSDKKSKKKHRTERSATTEHLDPLALEAARAGIADDSDDSDDIADLDAEDDEDSDADRAGGGLLDDAASEGSETEVSESERQRELEEAAYIRDYKRADTGMKDLLDMDDEAAERELNERYRLRKEQEKRARVDRPVRDSSNRFSADCLPKPTDPKVFAVKVRPGHARVLVNRIVNKCRAYLRGENDVKRPQDLGILSVFSVDHVKEWIYLEAHRQRFVETAITGLEHVFRFKIVQVDPKDLMSLLERQAVGKDRVQVGQYVRVKSGAYGGDIALVTKVLEEGHYAELQLVPRENFNGVQHREKWKKGMPRQPQHLFVSHLAVGVKEVGNGDVIWDGALFTKEGYLLQRFPTARLLVGSVCPAPTAEELVTYHAHSRDDIQRALQVVSGSKSKASDASYRIDEPVRVVSGQLTGAVGRVLSIDGQSHRVTIQTLADNRTGTVTVPLDEVSKHFVPGTHVVIDSGTHAGESGTVLVTQGTIAVVLSDEGQSEIRVDVANCKSSSMKSARPHTSGAHKLFDLVEMSGDKGVGCIVAFSGNAVSVLTPQNIVIRTTLEHIKQTLRDKNTATDRLLNTVTSRDAVAIDATNVPAAYAKMQCVVQQVHMSTLFVTSSHLRANAGMFAISSKQVVRVGGQAKHQKQSTFALLKTATRDPHPAKQATHIQAVVGARSVMSIASARTADHEIDLRELM